MSGIHPECPTSDTSDALFLQEPDEEEDEEEDEGDEEEDDDYTDEDGYSE
jgi:hypothetical protein